MDKNLISDFSNSEVSHSEQVHLSDYLSIIWRRKWIAVVFFISIVCVVSVKTINTKPVFKASTRVFLERDSSFMGRMAKVDMDPSGNSYNETQYKLLMSRGLAKKVIDDLELRDYLNSIMVEKPDYLTLAQKKVKKFFKQFLPKPKYKIANEQKKLPLGNEKDDDVPEAKDKVVDFYLSNLEVLPVHDASLVDIGFSSFSPKMAAFIANGHALKFIENDTVSQRLASRQALDWIKVQIRDQKFKVESSLQKLNKFKYEKLNPLFIEDENALSSPLVEDNPIINELRNRLTNLSISRAELSAKYGPKYPKIVEIDASISQLKQEIKNEIKLTRVTIKTEMDRALAFEENEANQATSSNVLDKDGKIITSDVFNYEMLKLEVESEKAIHDILLKQAKELNLTGNLETNNIRVVDKAEVPNRPSEPNVFMNFMMSVVVGLAFGIGLALFFEYMDNTIKTPGDIKQFLGTPVLGMLPYDKSIKRGKPVLQLENSNGKKRKGYGYGRYDISGNLSTCLSSMESKTFGQALLVQSATTGEGKTSVLVKSAISLAMGGLRVVMVDADLQRPSLHKLFALKNDGEKGLANVMEGIMLYEVRQGTLDKCSVDDIFFMIGLKKHSGQLVVRSDNQVMTAFFEKGRLFYLQSRDVPFANRLGTMLLRGGFITESQLKDALERNQRTGQPLGYILINAGYINQDQLQGPLKLQMEEHLQKLFSWKHGTFAFEPGSIETYEDKRIYFQEDYKPIINRLSRISETRLLERDILSYIHNVSEPNLSLLPAGKPNSRTISTVYFVSLMEKFLNILRDHYDVVLVDAAPILETMCSAKPLFSIVDGIIFVAKSGHVSVKQIKEAGDHLKKANANVVGAILNNVKERNSYSGYSNV